MNATSNENRLSDGIEFSSFKKGKCMRLLILSIFAAISLSSCPGSSANTSQGQINLSISNAVGSPSSGFGLTPFHATKVEAGSSSVLTLIFGSEGARKVEIGFIPKLTANRSCDTSIGAHCYVRLNLGSALATQELSKTANLSATVSGNTVTMTGTAHFESSDKTISYDVTVDSSATIIANIP